MSHRLSLVALSFLAAVPAIGQPLGTAFTYQGRLVDGGAPATGPFDLQLILFDGPAGGSQVGPILTLDDVAVSEGLFVVSLDFGAVFSGNRRWLQIGVRPGPTTGAYAVLSPRQELTAAPTALFSTTTPWGGVAAKPPGFADNVDNDVVGGLSCNNGQIPKFNLIGGWACADDANTIYTQGTGISITGTTIGIASGGVTSALIQDGTIAAADLAANSVTATQIATDAVGASEIAADAVGAAEIVADAVGSSEIAADAVGASEIAADAVGTAEIANGTVAVVDLNVTDVDARYLNTTEVLTAANYGDCGSYSIMSCSTFLAGQVGPACNNVPVGGLCRVVGAPVCAGTAAGVCGDGSTWYLKVTP